MSDSWFYRVGATQLGPVPRAELQRLVATGGVSPAAPVWSEGMLDWAPASQLFGFVAPEGGVQFLVPTGRTSMWSLTAGYLGLFGLVAVPLAPLALVFGILGLRDLRRHPEKNGWGRAITGIVLGGMMTLAMLALLALTLLQK